MPQDQNRPSSSICCVGEESKQLEIGLLCGPARGKKKKTETISFFLFSEVQVQCCAFLSSMQGKNGNLKKKNHSSLDFFWLPKGIHCEGLSPATPPIFQQSGV
jgi:hypothetical protein